MFAGVIKTNPTQEGLQCFITQINYQLVNLVN